MNRPDDSRGRVGYAARSSAPRRGRLTGPLGRFVGIVVGTVVALGALFVSAIAFSVVLVVATAAGGWLWWRTRELRKQLRNQVEQMQAALQQRGKQQPGTPQRATHPPGAGAQRGPGSFDRNHPFGRQGSPGRSESGPPRSSRDNVIDGDFIREAPADRSRAGRSDPH